MKVTCTVGLWEGLARWCWETGLLGLYLGLAIHMCLDERNVNGIVFERWERKAVRYSSTGYCCWWWQTLALQRDSNKCWAASSNIRLNTGQIFQCWWSTLLCISNGKCEELNKREQSPVNPQKPRSRYYFCPIRVKSNSQGLNFNILSWSATLAGLSRSNCCWVAFRTVWLTVANINKSEQLLLFQD